jgi:hypothetical protein
MWFNLAASGASPFKNAEATRRAVIGRDWLAKQMTPAQLAEAQQLARNWKPAERKYIPSLD